MLRKQPPDASTAVHVAARKMRFPIIMLPLSPIPGRLLHRARTAAIIAALLSVKASVFAGERNVNKSILGTVELGTIPTTPTLPHKGGGSNKAPSPLVGEGWGGGEWFLPPPPPLWGR